MGAVSDVGGLLQVVRYFVRSQIRDLISSYVDAQTRSIQNLITGILLPLIELVIQPANLAQFQVLQQVCGPK